MILAVKLHLYLLSVMDDLSFEARHLYSLDVITNAPKVRLEVFYAVIARYGWLVYDFYIHSLVLLLHMVVQLLLWASTILYEIARV